jgi:hypothetical protein
MEMETLIALRDSGSTEKRWRERERAKFCRKRNPNPNYKAVRGRRLRSFMRRYKQDRPIDYLTCYSQKYGAWKKSKVQIPFFFCLCPAISAFFTCSLYHYSSKLCLSHFSGRKHASQRPTESDWCMRFDRSSPSCSSVLDNDDDDDDDDLAYRVTGSAPFA